MKEPSDRQPIFKSGFLFDSPGAPVAVAGGFLVLGSVLYLGYVIFVWLKDGLWERVSINDVLARQISTEVSNTGWVGVDTMISYSMDLLFNGSMGWVSFAFGSFLFVVGLVVDVRMQR